MVWRMTLTHSHDCETTEQTFGGTLGNEEYSGPDEYKITVFKDVITCSDGDTDTMYMAEMVIGRRWGDHAVITFHDELSDDKTKLLYGMRQMIEDLKDAVNYLESL